jgi:short subunit dehydrogenase-like uncharacterized protein
MDWMTLSYMYCGRCHAHYYYYYYYYYYQVLNCSGPYRFLGEGVVEACIAAGAHYLDISGEPQFMERMFLQYHEAAKAARVLVIHGS